MSVIRVKQRAKLIAEWSGDSESITLYKCHENQLNTTVQSAKLRCLQILFAAIT